MIITGCHDNSNLHYLCSCNNCEAMNNVFKHATDIQRSLFGKGNYRLVHTFTRHKISPSVWAAKSEDDRNQHFRKFLKDFSKPNSRYVLSTDGTRTVPTPNGGKKPHQRKCIRAEKTTHKKRKRLF